MMSGILARSSPTHGAWAKKCCSPRAGLGDKVRPRSALNPVSAQPLVRMKTPAFGKSSETPMRRRSPFLVFGILLALNLIPFLASAQQAADPLVQGFATRQRARSRVCGGIG